jgi:hypothetical protein
MYGEKNFRDLFLISGKWLGQNLEIFSNSRVPFGNSVDCGLILDKYRGFFAVIDACYLMYLIACNSCLSIIGCNLF